MNLINILKWKGPVRKESDISIDEDIIYNLSDDIIKEVLRNAEIRFNSTIDDINRLKGDAFKILSILISILSVLIAIAFAEYSTDWLSNKVIKIVISIDILIVVISIFQLLKIIGPMSIMLKGESPAIFDFEDVSHNEKSQQVQSWAANSIRELDTKIIFNSELISGYIAILALTFITVSVSFAISLIFLMITIQ